MNVRDMVTLHVRAAFGAATFGVPRTPREAFESADRALYADKRSPRRD